MVNGCLKITNFQAFPASLDRYYVLIVIFIFILSFRFSGCGDATNTKNKETGEKSSSKALFFRKYYVTGSQFISLLGDGSCQFIWREHTFVAEYKGKWAKIENGSIEFNWDDNKMTLAPQKAKIASYHSYTYLAGDFSPARSIEENEKQITTNIDELKPGEQLEWCFVKIDSETFYQETGTTQPFVFYPELNCGCPCASLSCKLCRIRLTVRNWFN